MSCSKASVLVVPAVLAVLAMGACDSGAQTQVLSPEVRLGPAHEVRPQRVLVLKATCGSLEGRCPFEYARAVDGIVRGGLEFAGFNLVESEQLRNETRQRQEENTSETTRINSGSTTTVERPIPIFGKTTTSSSEATSHTETNKVVLDGPAFEDLSVDERNEILEKSGADSVVSVRVVVGGQMGIWAPDQNVEVVVKLSVNKEGSMVWASRCTASSNDFLTVSAALEHAARCATNGATRH